MMIGEMGRDGFDVGVLGDLVDGMLELNLRLLIVMR